jgi:subtilisin family serine protease
LQSKHWIFGGLTDQMRAQERSTRRRLVGFFCSALVIPLLSVVFTAIVAQAQLPRLGTGGSLPVGIPLGSIGDVGAAAGNIGNAVPSADSSPASTLIGTGIRIPIGEGVSALTGPADTITKTIDDAGKSALSIPGRAAGLPDLVNPAIGKGAGAAGKRRGGAPPSGERRFVPNEIVLRMPSTLTGQELDDLARRHNLIQLESRTVGLTGATFHRWLIQGNRSISAVIRALEAEGAVAAAQPNYRFLLARDAGSQTAGASGTASQEEVQYASAKLELPQAHHLASGDKIRVAVIDSGIDASHPEIEGRIADSFDAVGSSEPPHGHGTGMASTIVAHDKLTGTAPSARILAVRAFTVTSKGPESTTFTLLRAIDWAVAHGAQVINMSFAGPTDPEIADALAAARKKGVVLIAAAGNAGPKAPPLFPASDANVIAVTATDIDDKPLDVAGRGKHIAIAAPGVAILVAAPNDAYQTITGTSVAAAHISGLAALLLQRKPNLTPDGVKRALLSTATDLGPKGRDDQFGAGLANAYRAVRSLEKSTPLAAR